jgi:hypothetical protein
MTFFICQDMSAKRQAEMSAKRQAEMSAKRQAEVLANENFSFAFGERRKRSGTDLRVRPVARTKRSR